MEDAEKNRLLRDIAGRADHAGHVLVEERELPFAQSDEGSRWLEPIDPGKRLYKLSDMAQQQLRL